MANSPQAIKRIRQNDKTRELQKGQASAVRTAVAKAEAAIVDQADNAQELFVEASKSLDKAASKGLIHKNKAARKKSRLSKLVNNN